MLDRAGEPRSAEELTDTTTWSSYAQASALFRAAEEVSGDPDVALHAGEELLLQYADTEVAALLRSLGSPTEVLRNIAATAAKYSTVTDMEALEVGDGSVVVSARTTGGIERERALLSVHRWRAVAGDAPVRVAEGRCGGDRMPDAR